MGTRQSDGPDPPARFAAPGWPRSRGPEPPPPIQPRLRAWHGPPTQGAPARSRTPCSSRARASEAAPPPAFPAAGDARGAAAAAAAAAAAGAIRIRPAFCPCARPACIRANMPSVYRRSGPAFHLCIGPVFHLCVGQALHPCIRSAFHLHPRIIRPAPHLIRPLRADARRAGRRARSPTHPGP
jgi:hypothetical protein